MKKSCLAFVGVVCTVVSLSAEIGPSTDVASRARGAGRIVVARVLDIHAQFATNRFGDQLIVSTAVLDVNETLKGAPSAVLQVAVEGGTVGDLTLKVSDVPMLKAGDKAVFFLESDSTGTLRPHDRGRGILMLSDADRVVNDNISLDDVRDQVRAALRGAR